MCDTSFSLLDKVITRLCLSGKLLYSYNGYKRARKLYRPVPNMKLVKEQYRFLTGKDKFTFTHIENTHKIDVYFKDLEKGFLMGSPEYLNGDGYDRQAIKKIVSLEAYDVVVNKIKNI